MTAKLRVAEFDLETGRPEVDPAKLTGKSQGMVTNICPNLEGGKSPASPASYSPQTGLFYVPTNNLCMDWQSEEAAYIRGTVELTGAKAVQVSFTREPDGYLWVIRWG